MHSIRNYLHSCLPLVSYASINVRICVIRNSLHTLHTMQNYRFKSILGFYLILTLSHSLGVCVCGAFGLLSLWLDYFPSLSLSLSAATRACVCAWACIEHRISKRVHIFRIAKLHGNICVNASTPLAQPYATKHIPCVRLCMGERDDRNGLVRLHASYLHAVCAHKLVDAHRFTVCVLATIQLHQNTCSSHFVSANDKLP